MNLNRWLKIVLPLIALAIISFLLFITACQSEASNKDNKNQIISIAKSFFFITHDYKKDIIVYVSILNSEKYKDTAIKIINTSKLFMRSLMDNGFIEVGGIENNPESLKYDIHIVQFEDVIVIAISNLNKNTWEEKIFIDEKDGEIAIELSSKIFGREL